jgi:hypothetical protein
LYERPRDEDGNEKPRRGDGPKPKPLAKIASQFREASNMAYELDCQGQPLIVRIFELPDGWRIEARTSNDAEAVVAEGTGASRSAAFELCAAQWREKASARLLASFDWPAVSEALRGVRAI